MTRGFSPKRVARMDAVMGAHVESGQVPGIVTLISRHGETHVVAHGMQAAGGSAPMRRDSLFRISSMTKPIVAAATMMLVEECRLRLDDPVDRLIPELANRQVLKRLDGPLDDTVPAARPITVRDLLTCRMGFGIVMAPPDAYPIQRAVTEQQIMTLGMDLTPLEPDAWLRRFAQLPLMGQPGERWMYHTSYWVLAALLTRAADRPLEEFLRERIFAPLGMDDTGFSVPDSKIDRLAGFYEADHETGGLRPLDPPDASRWRRMPAFPSGGGELVSTVDDYFAFGQMLLNKGQYGRVRLLSRPSVELMATDQLNPGQKAGSELFLGENRGWGLGVSMITRRDDVASSPGRFGWDGGYGTSWYVDPKEDLNAILMTQVLGFPSGIDSDFWTSAYQAFDD